MDRDLDPLQALEKGEETPGRIDGEMRLDVDQPPEEPAIERVPDRQHHRREAKLEIDRGDEPALAADAEDCGRLVEVGPHRLLDENMRAGRNALEHRTMRGRRRREIDDRAVGRQRLVERAEDLYAEFARRRSSPAPRRDRRRPRPDSPPWHRPENARRRRSSPRRSSRWVAGATAPATPGGAKPDRSSSARSSVVMKDFLGRRPPVALACGSRAAPASARGSPTSPACADRRPSWRHRPPSRRRDTRNSRTAGSPARAGRSYSCGCCSRRSWRGPPARPPHGCACIRRSAPA